MNTFTVGTANLLQGKDVVVEELVQLLVGEVDAQLLERVDGEILKAKNVQNTFWGLTEHIIYI